MAHLNHHRSWFSFKFLIRITVGAIILIPILIILVGMDFSKLDEIGQIPTLGPTECPNPTFFVGNEPIEVREGEVYRVYQSYEDWVQNYVISAVPGGGKILLMNGEPIFVAPCSKPFETEGLVVDVDENGRLLLRVDTYIWGLQRIK